jgi:hypothetical protein
MKRLTQYLMKQCIYMCALVICSTHVFAQCPSGYSKFTLKWDYLDFLIYNAQYTSGNGYLPNIAAAQTQNFAFANQRLVISHNYSNIAFSGENTTSTGQTGSYGNSNGTGSDADVQFIGDGRITLTFDTAVYNVQFSLFDVDQEQQANITASDALGAALPINITLLGGATTKLTLTGNATTAPQVSSTGSGNIANSQIKASFNVDIAGPVKQVIINISGTNTGAGADNGSFWLSDISACTTISYPTSYYSVSKPYTGMPSYVLHSLDKTVYMVDPATGKTKVLFTDAAVASYINSMAYDPYNKVLYYVSNGAASPSANRAIKKYDFTTETISTVLADINTIGIPTSNAVGIEGGGAAFYNGSLFLAIQTTNSNNTSGRESVIWRIDFNSSSVPYRASQVYALPTDDGSGLLHKWGDFAIKDGVLFDSDASGNDPDMYHFNMTTGLATIFPGASLTFNPGSLAEDWAGNLYEIMGDTATASYTVPNIALYTEDGDIGTTHTLVSSPAYNPVTANLGDGAEAFLPKVDFGDAPSSYDAVSLNMAVHEKDVNLRLGSSWGNRFAQISNDPNDDGMGAAPALDYFGTTTYSISVNVFNNTGANATMVAWLDWNFDGVFQASEGRSITVPTSASSQLVPLSWTMWVPYTTNTNTWLRVRITSTSNGMTTSSIGGYFTNGEIEDYPVVMGALLARNLLAFSATASNKKTVDLSWQLNTAPNFVRTVVERSRNSLQFDSLGAVNAGNGIVVSYTSKDEAPYSGISYYRLKLVFSDGSIQYSDIKSVSFDGNTNSLQINLNPANQYTTLKINSSIATVATIDLTDNTGRLLLRRSVQLNAGENFERMNDLSRYSAGIYYVHVKTTAFSAVEKLFIKHD